MFINTHYTQLESTLEIKPLHRTTAGEILLAMILLTIIAIQPVNATDQMDTSIKSYGTINRSLTTKIGIFPNSITASNNLSLGFQISYGSADFISDPVMQQLASEGNFKLVRFFDTLKSQCIPSMNPCSNVFNETSKFVTYNWTNIDNVIKKIFDIGAEPIVCLGTFSANALIVPEGMIINSTTGLPNATSYAAYASEWVNHFASKQWPVRFYEIGNEPWECFGWDPINYIKLSQYKEFFNVVATEMRLQNPGILISFDFIARQPVLDYWLSNNGANVDFIDFHDYGAVATGKCTDDAMFLNAEQQYFEKWPLGYNVTAARNIWFSSRGKYLPIIMSESNFNSGCEGGTEPRNQQMAGAVWDALVLRRAIIEDISYSVFFELASSASYGKTTVTGGYGFGMINADNNNPWYPYYAITLISKNLQVGDFIRESNSSENIESLVWSHDGTLNILIISKSDNQQIICLSGISGNGIITKIDNTIAWQTPNIQTGEVDFTKPLLLEGYTVALLQQPNTII